jgi:hypothetical protein
MLTLYQYSSLDNNDKAELLWKEGEFLYNTVENSIVYNLYSLYNFYVELIMINGYVHEVAPFKEGNRLEKYLSQIDIKEVQWRKRGGMR